MIGHNVDNTLLKSLVVFVSFGLGMVIISLVVLLCRNAFAGETEWLEQCATYEQTVKSILIENGVSEDFYYLMVAESHCREDAVSVKGAQSFWQLMPLTAKTYSCHDLSNIECATNAAARYIAHLSKSFTSFNDIIIAYNMGGRNYRRNGATKQAKGLVQTVNRLMKIDKGNK